MKYYLESTDRVPDSVKKQPEGPGRAGSKNAARANGRNKLNEGEHATMLERFLLQLKEPMRDHPDGRGAGVGADKPFAG